MGCGVFTPELRRRMVLWGAEKWRLARKNEVWDMATIGRVLDKDFEDGIMNRADEMQREAQTNIDDAKEYMYDTNEEVEAMIREHPKSFVLGAFIGGVALGTIFSRGSK